MTENKEKFLGILLVAMKEYNITLSLSGGKHTSLKMFEDDVFDLETIIGSRKKYFEFNAKDIEDSRKFSEEMDNG